MKTKCIISTYAKDRDGYAQGYNPLTKKPQLHHRLVYEQHYGAIPKGLVVRHKCDNPSCVNIEHLELGTHQDNQRDKVLRKRHQHGTTHWKHKLTEQDVLCIRARPKETYKEIALEYDVSKSTIQDIFARRTWRHI
jgi:hypothetical protein